MPPHDALQLVNLQSEVAGPFLAAIAEALSAHGDLSVRLDDTGDWRDRRTRLLDGDAALGFWCGLPYAREAERPDPRVTLLAAPVMAAPRYADRPVYFSDVMVRDDAPARAIADLEGATWAYNEPDSLSGHWLPRCELARSGLAAPFFGRVVEAGSHTRAIAMIRDGTVDAAAIDSTVLDMLRASAPGRVAGLRAIARWGPGPMPPLVASTRLSEPVRRRLTDALLALQGNSPGRAALAVGRLARFAAVTDADYDVARAIAATGAVWHWPGEQSPRSSWYP